MTDANNASIAGGEGSTITKVTADGGARTAGLCIIDDDLATRANFAADWVAHRFSGGGVGSVGRPMPFLTA
ncbi:MAG: hypothetical protein HOP29_11085 [Phycisphaerales bacterium]|nr:hypothetical protein [Phycisphaerales bacterium]